MVSHNILSPTFCAGLPEGPRRPFFSVEEGELSVESLYLVVNVDRRFLVEECVRSDDGEHVHEEVVDAPVPGMHELCDVL